MPSFLEIVQMARMTYIAVTTKAKHLTSEHSSGLASMQKCTDQMKMIIYITKMEEQCKLLYMNKTVPFSILSCGYNGCRFIESHQNTACKSQCPQRRPKSKQRKQVHLDHTSSRCERAITQL